MINRLKDKFKKTEINFDFMKIVLLLCVIFIVVFSLLLLLDGRKFYG